MKKNNMMRAAGVLLIAVLLTTSVISGTFAKYVTSDTADDSARVAMFGVKIETEGALFAKNYLTTDNTPAGDSAGASLSVKSSGALGAEGNQIGNVVAPGTKNEDGLVFSVTGTPEVAVNVELNIVTNTASDIWLGTGVCYPNMTTGEVYDKSTAKNASGDEETARYNRVTFNNTEAYYPIKYTLQHSTDGSAYSPIVTTETKDLPTDQKKYYTNVSLSEIVKYLDTLSKSEATTFEPGVNLAETFGYYKLTWVWDFEAYTAEQVGSATDRTNPTKEDMMAANALRNKQDTMLGDLAAQKYGTNVTVINDAVSALKTAFNGVNTTDYWSKTNNLPADFKDARYDKSGSSTTAPTDMYNYNLEVNLEFTITVTQVD